MGNLNCCFMITAATFFFSSQSPRGTVTYNLHTFLHCLFLIHSEYIPNTYTFYSLNMVKRSLDNHLMGSRKTIRPLLVDRCMIQHEFRVNESAKTTFTATHQKVLLNLLQLATSHYAVVRIRAQARTIQL
jgi:hypothetical protein